jgi:hypothetical protein
VEARHPDIPIKIAAPAKPTRPVQAGAPITASLQLIQSLFRNPQGAAVAVLLAEILGKPKSQR